MAVAPSIAAVQCLLSFASSSAHTEPFQSVPISLPSQRIPLFFSTSRSRTIYPVIAAASSNRKNKKKLLRDHVSKGDDDDDFEEEDAFELLFKQLEEDLKNDDLSKDGSGDDDDEITEEDLALLERELEDALGDFDAETLNPVLNDADTCGGGNEQEDEDDGDGDGVEEDERLPKLRTWQMKKLARALKAGKRKTSIKNLAADLCLDRALVLELLRDPPPNLLMMSLSIPDEPTARVTPLETKPIIETVSEETSMVRAESEPAANAKVPVHVMQHRWSAQKRLKKAQIDTLEKVYRRSKRPTNAMVSSIVHVTNIPRRRVVKWFEDKRAEEGVPDHRAPYQRPVSETA